MASHTYFAVGKWMKFATSDWSIELINHPFTMEFSVHHLKNVESASEGWGKYPLIYPNLVLAEMFILTAWDHKT